MKQCIRPQQGSAALIAVAVFVLIALAVTGWLVWKAQGTSEQKKETNLQGSDQQKTESNQTLSMLDGKIRFEIGKTWKVASGGYWSKDSGRCGRGTDEEQGCVDHRMLIPATETFTNPDQYQVNIAIFDDDRSPGVSLQTWIDNEVGPGGNNPRRSHPTINGYEAYRYEVAYSKDDVRLIYGILVKDKIIVVSSNFFRGDSGSFKSTTDYLPYISKVDTLASSITVK